MRLNDEFAFADTEPSIIIFCVGDIRNLRPLWIMFFYAFLYSIIKVNHFCIALIYYYI